MNFFIIQNDKVPNTVKPPFPIIQMFTDEEVVAMDKFIDEMIKNHGDLDTDLGCKAAHRFLHLISQWEHQSQ